jgi:hypothetical protein
MSKETLKRLRLIIPGIIIMLYIVPGMTKTTDELLGIGHLFSNLKWSDTSYLGVTFVLGALYYALNVRWLVWKHYNKIVQENIKDTILNECTLTLSSKQWNLLKKGNAIMVIFYDFVDNNESLKDKANDVRFNGLIWTTCFDMSILSAIAGFVYSILFLTTTRSNLVYISVAAFWVFFISLAFSSILTYKHLAKSTEQLDVIKQKYKPAIDEKIKETMTNLEI